MHDRDQTSPKLLVANDENVQDKISDYKMNCSSQSNSRHFHAPYTTE